VQCNEQWRRDEVGVECKSFVWPSSLVVSAFCRRLSVSVRALVCETYWANKFAASERAALPPSGWWVVRGERTDMEREREGDCCPSSEVNVTTNMQTQPAPPPCPNPFPFPHLHDFMTVCVCVCWSRPFVCVRSRVELFKLSYYFICRF